MANIGRYFMVSAILALSLFWVEHTNAQECANATLQCVPIHGSTSFCLRTIPGNNISWFDAKAVCEKDGGRLAHFGSYSAEDGLINFGKGYNIIRIGLLSSIIQNNATVFFQNSSSSDGMCTSENNSVCSATTNSTECDSLGCCYNKNRCKNKDIEYIAPFMTTNAFNASTLKPNERQCVQVLKNGGHNRTWVPYNCSEPGDVMTGYICEHKCVDDWPFEKGEAVTYAKSYTSTPSSEHTSQHSAREQTQTPSYVTTVGFEGYNEAKCLRKDNLIFILTLVTLLVI